MVWKAGERLKGGYIKIEYWQTEAQNQRFLYVEWGHCNIIFTVMNPSYLLKVAIGGLNMVLAYLFFIDRKAV